MGPPRADTWIYVNGQWRDQQLLDIDWTNLTLEAGWSTVSGRTPGVCLRHGIVYLRGQANGTGTSLLATLPAWASPSMSYITPASGTRYLAITASGAITPNSVESFVSLAGVTYPAAG